MLICQSHKKVTRWPSSLLQTGGTHCSCQVAAHPTVGQELQFDVRVPLPAVLDVLMTSYAVLAVKQKQATATTKALLSQKLTQNIPGNLLP